MPLDGRATILAKGQPQRQGWEYKDGSLYCDGMPLEELRHRLLQEFSHLGSPAYVYSAVTLKHNVARYVEALGPLGNHGILSYSLKANNNLHLIATLRDAGVSMATTVSGNEIIMAIKCGFPPERIIFNGNGKRRWEVEMAVNRGVLLNIDSAFDAHQVIDVCKQLGKKARALLRLNPALDAQTHPYLATALADSKFGVEMGQVEEVLEIVGAFGEPMVGETDTGKNKLVDLKGVHIHIGSAITKIQVYAEMTKIASETLEQIQKSGWPDASIINLGGGLSIDQTVSPYNLNTVNGDSGVVTATSDSQTLCTESTSPQQNNIAENVFNSSVTSGSQENAGFERRTFVDINRNNTITSLKPNSTVTTSSSFPTPKELVEVVHPHLPENATLILEPGRSLVATAGIVMTNILGVKSNAGKEYIVVDAAMTEVIRPALYSAIHPVTHVTVPRHQEVADFDVVGPVCESGDFLIRRCPLHRPPSWVSPTLASPAAKDSHLSTALQSSSVTFPGTALAVWNTGAYCSSMSSNYNLRPHAVEVLIISPSEYRVIRKPQQFEDLIQGF